MKKLKTVQYKGINIEIYTHTLRNNKKVKPYMTYFLVSKSGKELQGESRPYKNKELLIKDAKEDIRDWYDQFFGGAY
jgi:hypothetical protein